MCGQQAEYVELLKKHAFRKRGGPSAFPTTRPRPMTTKRNRFNSLDDLRAFKREGALLLMASKPDLRTPRRDTRFTE